MFFRISLLLALLLVPANSYAQIRPTLTLLKDLVAIDTTNPPGNETVAADYVADYLKGFGIPSKIIESAPGRGNLIARLPGTGKQKPLMLLAHLDVVTADPAEWRFPPFNPTLSGGYLYGRGVMDMKGQAALMINTFVEAKRQHIPLSGDLLLVLVADEEAGGGLGAGYLVKNHWEEIAPGLVINEGSIGMEREGRRYYPIQVAEKGVAWMKLIAAGSSGHGSMPIPDNAPVHLIRALDKISQRPQPLQQTPIVQEMLDRLAPHFSFPKSFFLKHLFDFPIRQLVPVLAGSKISGDRILNAMLRNTIVPTVLEAGRKTNVIPAEAKAEVDCRILPGETPEGFRQKIVGMIDDPSIRIEWIQAGLPTQSDYHTPQFAALQEAIEREEPQAIVFPLISPGGTDMRFFREKGVPAYGIIPLLITMEDIAGLHGKNERIAVAELEKGERVLMGFVKKWGTLSGP